MRSRYVFIIIAIVLLSTVAGIATAATVTQNITYQGVLTDSSGNPRTGTYSMTFKVYDAATGGSVLSTDTHSVTVTNGLFTTPVTFVPGIFDGRAVWLGIKVGTDPEMTPRQEIRPVPYALGLRPGVVGASFTTNQAGTGWPGIPGVNVLTSYQYNPGVMIGTNGNNSEGVYAETWGDYSKGLVAETVGDNSEGVLVRTNGYKSNGLNAVVSGSDSVGVFAVVHGQRSYAIRAINDNNVDPLPIGIYGEARNNNGVGVLAQGKTGLRAVATQSGNGMEVWRGPNGGVAAEFNGNVRVNKYGGANVMGTTVIELGEGLDYAEGFNVSNPAKIMPGTVLVIDPDNPGKLCMSSEPYDRKVAGIVSGAGNLDSAIKVGGEQFDENVALAGRVYCNADASYGAIEAGDLLTTSATPGYAMVVTDHDSAQGAILGKAMEPLAEGQKGQILVLVTLQ